MAFPSVILDSLYFVRAWNNHADILTGGPAVFGGLTHALLSPLAAAGDRDTQLWVSRWLREFWFKTAPLCGTEVYRDLLAGLRALGNFEELWFEMALTRSEEPKFIQAAHRVTHPAVGSLWKTITSIDLPPRYFLYQYFPIDADAERTIKEGDQATATQVSMKSSFHWRSDSYASDGSSDGDFVAGFRDGADAEAVEARGGRR